MGPTLQPDAILHGGKVAFIAGLDNSPALKAEMIVANGKTPMSLISKSELADASTAIEAAGFKTTEFQISESRDPPPAAVVHTITGTVTVTRKDGKTKIYAAGHGSKWPAELDRNLKTGVFGRP
jgi:hypothetical protein